MVRRVFVSCPHLQITGYAKLCVYFVTLRTIGLFMLLHKHGLCFQRWEPLFPIITCKGLFQLLSHQSKQSKADQYMMYFKKVKCDMKRYILFAVCVFVAHYYKKKKAGNAFW